MAGTSPTVVAAILCGGSGTRFWPLSRRDRPKQFLPLFGQHTMLAETIARAEQALHPRQTLLVSAASQKEWLAPYANAACSAVLEPEAKNTAACCALVARQLVAQNADPATVIATFPADHWIESGPAFAKALQSAATVATASRGLVTFGIVPSSPHTGYGYIEVDRKDARFAPAHRALRFREKPDRATAEQFVSSGSFLWNSGIFLWRLDTIVAALEKHWPEGWRTLAAWKPGDDLAPTYRKLPSQPVDVAILEKADNVLTIPASFRWSDVGSWSALYELLAKETAANVAAGRATVEADDSRGNLAYSERGERVVFLGVEDLVVVESAGTILVAPRSRDQEVRRLAERLDKK